MTVKLKSPAFDAGGTIPTQYTCEDENISPPLEWHSLPGRVESLVLICDDPDAPRGVWSHWVLYDIPADRDGLPQDFASAERTDKDGVQGRNDFGDLGYGGPCPPQGSEHRYYFRLYALDSKLGLPPGANRHQVLEQLEEHVVDRTELIGRYAR
jgi:Raf kinase inhibitor-like YbhB/YbcL family protein